MKRMQWMVAVGLAWCLLAPLALAQTVSAPKLKYVMTYQADLEPAVPVAQNRLIFNVTGGWLKTADGGTGTIIQPSADWLHVLPNGTFKLDVRGSARMDDGSVIFIEYTGLLKLTAAGAEKFNKGERVSGDDFYFITSPIMQTTSAKYGWINDAMFISKGVEIGDKAAHVKYDTYMVVP